MNRTCRRARSWPALIAAVVILTLAACDSIDEGAATATAEAAPVSPSTDPVVEGDGDPTGTSVPVTVADPTALTTTACPFEPPSGYDVSCGTLAVPENRRDAASPLIHLAVAIVAAPGGGSQSPIVYLAGGPGGSAIDDFIDDPEGWDYPFTENRDLILLDQRGTGFSEPSLDCPENSEMKPSEEPERACFERLTNAGIDLGAYNTRENAADVAALRSALAVTEWNLLAISYGTRLALEVMRVDPTGIRAVVLDSPFPPDVDVPLDEVYATTEALTALFADCDRDPHCRETYPDLETVFLDAVARLNADETAPIFGDDLVIAVQTAFTDTELVPLVPYVIYEVANGNFAAIDEIAPVAGAARIRYQADIDRSDAEGMYLSVMCNDEYALGDYERVEAQVVGTIPQELEGVLLQSTFELSETCGFWSPQQGVDNTPVTSDLPVLILVGQYDVATPPSWGRLTARSLPNATLFEFPGAGHSLLGGLECATALTDAFLENPLQPPAGGCIDDIVWPRFE